LAAGRVTVRAPLALRLLQHVAEPPVGSRLSFGDSHHVDDSTGEGTSRRLLVWLLLSLPWCSKGAKAHLVRGFFSHNPGAAKGQRQTLCVAFFLITLVQQKGQRHTLCVTVQACGKNDCSSWDDEEAPVCVAAFHGCVGARGLIVGSSNG